MRQHLAATLSQAGEQLKSRPVRRRRHAVVQHHVPTSKVHPVLHCQSDLLAYGSEGFPLRRRQCPLPDGGAGLGRGVRQDGIYGRPLPITYNPDSVWSYELGEKAKFFDRRLTVNASVSHEDWNHFQLKAYQEAPSTS